MENLGANLANIELLLQNLDFKYRYDKLLKRQTEVKNTIYFTIYIQGVPRNMTVDKFYEGV